MIRRKLHGNKGAIKTFTCSLQGLTLITLAHMLSTETTSNGNWHGNTIVMEEEILNHSQ